jgi:hypothetical protein
MRRKSLKSCPKKGGCEPARKKREPAERRQAVLVLTASFLILAGLVTWAVCSDKSGWRDWLGGLRVKHVSFGRADQDDGGSAGPGQGDGQTQFQGTGYATLGAYSVDRVDPLTGTTLTVCFQLGGQTICRNEESFRTFMDQNYPSFREHVAGSIRDCESSDLADERSLGRKVMVRVNRLLGRHFLQSVEFDELTIYETVGSYEPTIWKPGEKH